MITSVELLFGMVVNRQLHLNVWDYSGEQYNFQGQICLLYSNLWFLRGVASGENFDGAVEKAAGKKHY